MAMPFQSTEARTEARFDNVPKFDDLDRLSIGEIADMPPDLLLALQEAAASETARVKRQKDRFEAALAQRYSAATEAERSAQGKTSGTVRIEDAGVVVIADLPKKVTWDQDRLAAMATRIREAGDDPTQYLEIAYRVPASGPGPTPCARASPPPGPRPPANPCSGSRSETGDARRRDARAVTPGRFPFGTRSPPPPRPFNQSENPMAFRIITADERLSAAENKTSLAIFGPPGVGKTTLLKSLPAEETVCLDLEAGMKSVQDWRGASIPVRSFTDFRDLAVLIGGPDPAQNPQSWYGTERHAWLQAQHRDSGIEAFLGARRIVFVDSITDLSRQAMAYARQQPEAFSDRTSKPDVRGAYGLLGREVIQALKHLQHARGKTVIFVGVLEKVTDDFGAVTWQPQMEGSKAGRELPGIVDQVVSMQLFARDAEGGWVLDETASDRRLVCKSGNPWGLPAKDRSGRLDLTEPPDLSALLARIDGRASHQPAFAS